MFSSDFYEIFKNTFSTEHLQWLLLIDFLQGLKYTSGKEDRSVFRNLSSICSRKQFAKRSILVVR